MKFKEWKAGDEAFLINLGWIILEPLENPVYPLQFRDYSFTKDGRQWTDDRYPSLLDHNPFNPDDPKNSPEFKSNWCDWSFMLNERPVFEGDILYHFKCQKKAFVTRLSLHSGKVWCGIKEYCDLELISENFCWPDEIVTKKKVADWVYTYTRYWGEVWVEFAKGLTEEEVNRLHGASGVTIRMIPGTEREVEE